MMPPTRRLIQTGAMVLLLAMLIEIWTRETTCETDPDFKLGDVDVSTCRFFSEKYDEARSKFIKAATAAGAELHSFPVVGEDYVMDIAVLQGNLPGVVVHTSGYHGVEGYAGSAIQVAWLSTQLQTSERPTVILVHAVNPFGMATYRRTDQDNVDLNRNGIHAEKLPAVLQRDPNFCGYQDFDETLFNPRHAPTLFDLYFRAWYKVVWAIYRHGLPALKKAMVTGQYHYEPGVFYGGKQLQPSLQILWDFLETHVPENQAFTMVNVHTGLGPSGEDTMLALADAGISPQDAAQVFAGSHIPQLHQAANEVAAGYELVVGTAEGFFGKLHGAKPENWVVTQEFGTVPLILVGVALIVENSARQYLPEAEALEWTTLTRRVFYVRTPQWRQKVLSGGIRVLNQAISRHAT